MTEKVDEVKEDESLWVALGKCLFALVITPFIFLFAAALSTLAGALSGLAVGWLFPQTFGVFLHVLGLEYVMWQVGAVLGFLSAFLKMGAINTAVSNSVMKKKAE